MPLVPFIGGLIGKVPLVELVELFMGGILPFWPDGGPPLDLPD